MWHRLIIDGNAVYEIDEECMRKKQGKSSSKGGYGPGRSSGRDGEKNNT